MLDMVVETVREYKMLDKGDSIVVGVSGGADSVVLLHVLHRLQKEYDLKLCVAHLNHMFRGSESDEDGEYVAGLCKELAIPAYIETVDVPAYMRQTGLSSEVAARIKRYELYQKVAKSRGANKIALGHNADDQAETVLMRILKGSGLKGLAGIPPVRMMDDLVIIRPLINVRRSLIEKYCAEQGLAFRVDSTNLKPMYLRNKLRLELLPLLEKEYNVNVVSHLTVLADLVRDENSYMEQVTDEVYESLVDRGEAKADRAQFPVSMGTELSPGHTGNFAADRELSPVSLRVSTLINMSVALARRVLRKALSECKGDTLDIEFGHVDGILKQLSSDRVNWQLHLPSGVVVQKEYDVLRFVPEPATEKQFQYRLEIPGITFVPEAGIVLEAEILHVDDFEEREGIIKSLDGKESVGFDYKCLHTPLFVRNRKPGDRINVFGMQGSKKVKDILIDEKIPPHKRINIPLLIGGDNVIYWIVGSRAGSEACITDSTSEIVIIKAYKTIGD